MAEFESVVDYSTKLENFEGPLDLLLHLIKEAKIEIKDIFVSEVTAQILQYMDGVTTLDIVDNHGYNITTVQADTVAAQFNNSDKGSLAVINGNYALAAGLKISDALAVEDASGSAAQTYANIIAVRKGDENSAKITALINALKTDKVKQYIADTYNGAVIAIF